MSKVTVKEIEYALHGIGDLKAPGEDGCGAKFFKVCWSFIKKDVIAAVMEFFFIIIDYTNRSTKL